MVNTDSIADMIVRIKNAALTRKEQVVFQHSKFTASVVSALERAGYIEALPKKSKKVMKQIEAKLVYADGNPRFNGAQRLSKPSKRIYKGINEIMPIKSGHGSLIISTPKGVLTDKEARKENVGGEILFQIW